MKKTAFLITLTLAAFYHSAQAAWIGSVKIKNVVSYSSGYVHLAIHNPPSSSTCTHWGYHFQFDASTSGGEKMYKALMAAATTGNVVNIGFGNSTAPGSDHNSGCTNDTMAVLWNVGYHGN